MMKIHWSDLSKNLKPTIIDKMMADAINIPGLLSLAAGFTDNEALPATEVKEACMELLNGEHNECLQYGQNSGRNKLREQSLESLRKSDKSPLNHINLEQVSITNGSQQALYLSAQALCNPGDIVLLQDPSYFVFIELLKGLGIHAVGIPCNSDGSIQLDEFEHMLKAWKNNGKIHKLKLIYLCTYFANSSTHSMSREEKSQFGKRLQKLDIQKPIIEDAAYRQLYYDAPHEAPSILSMPEFKEQACLYCETYTKPFSTGLKVGYLISNNTEWPDMLRKIKTHQDFGTAHFNQAIIEYCIENNSYENFLKKARVHYKMKMTQLHETLKENKLQDYGWHWNPAKGGLLLWLQAKEGINTNSGSELHKKCLANKVLYVPGNICFPNQEASNFIRLSFGALNNADLKTAANRFCKAAKEI